jgi:hypothetical protein
LAEKCPAGASIIGKKTAHLGTVEASDEKAAIAEAMKAFHITSARLFKLAVTRTRIEERKRGEMKAPAARNGTLGNRGFPRRWCVGYGTAPRQGKLS